MFMTDEQFPTPDDQMFALWRAVFALVHVDGAITEEEVSYIEKIKDAFNFTRKQKKIIKTDLKNRQDVASLFEEITQVNYQRQFFVMARTIIWCDGYLHELELEAVNKIVKNLGEDRTKFENELRWIERKPVTDEGRAPEALQEDMIKIVFRKMSAFYKEKTI